MPRVLLSKQGLAPSAYPPNNPKARNYQLEGLSRFHARSIHVIVTEKEDLAARVMEITEGRGANLRFDGRKSGALWPVIDRIFRPLESIVEAHRYLESNQQKGKIVVTV